MLYVSSGELISGCNSLGRCELSRDLRKTQLATGSLLTVWWRMPVSGAEIAPRHPDLAIAHLIFCLWRVEGPVCSWLALLWCLLNPLFCEQAQLCVRLEPSTGKFSLSLFFSLSGYLTAWVASSFSLSAVYSGLVLTLSMQPHIPVQLSGGRQHLGYFSSKSCD